MSYEQITRLADQAAEKARVMNKQPKVLTGLGDDALSKRMRLIPFLGGFVPTGWREVNVSKEAPAGQFMRCANECLMVDSSGFGAPGEGALTFQEFAEYIQRHPGYGYGILEAGQFQVCIGVFEKIAKAKAKRVQRTEDSRVANHIDGLDRDNLGESPDY
jgi:hypothetical protein